MKYHLSLLRIQVYVYQNKALKAQIKARDYTWFTSK